MEIADKVLGKFQKTADVIEIQMLMSRYVTLMDQMNANVVFEELFAYNNPEVSIEYTDIGRYEGPEHVKAFMAAFHKNLQNISDKRGWLDFTDTSTPDIAISNDGTRAYASWNVFSPKAKQATPGGSAERTLTAFWFAGKIFWELIKEKSQWRILHFQLATYFTTPYHTGWLKQQECFREIPFWALHPDQRPRFYVYHPDKVYTKNGQYNWGPYIPSEGSF